MKVEIKDLLEAGAHFGHKSEKWNPKMKPFIFAKKSGIHIIDLTKTKEKLEEALDYVKKSVQEGKNILFVGTKKQAQQSIKEEAEKANMPYVSERWLGGTLTNFQTVIKQVKKLINLREEKEKGEWEKFIKKERIVKQKELERLEKSIGGLESLRELPDILFIIDITKEYLAVKEARRLEIPIVGIVDSNADPTLVDYPIPSNDDALKVIKLITSMIAQTILEVNSVRSKSPEVAAPLSEGTSNGVKPSGVKDKDIDEKDEKEKPTPTRVGVKEDIEEIEEKLEEKIDEEEIEAKKTPSLKTLPEKRSE